MENKKSSPPTRGRGGSNAARGGSPPRSQQRGNRATYNNWASQRQRAPTSNASGSPERGQRQRGARRATVHSVQSPDLFDSPVPNEGLSNSSSDTGLNRIRQLLDNIDNYISADDTVISIHDDAPQSSQPAQSEAESPNNRSQSTYSSIHGARPRIRRRLPFDGRSSNRGANQSTNRTSQASSPSPANSTQLTSPQNNLATEFSPGLDISPASRRFQNIPLRFRRENVLRAPSPDSSDDQLVSELGAARPHIEPIQANAGSFLQGLGTEEEPFELSPDSPDEPSVLLPSFIPDDDEGNYTNPTSSGGGGNGSSNGLRAGGRRSFGLAARLRAGGLGMGGDNNPPGAVRRVLSSPPPVLPPPGTLSDEELARRLQEEEWDAASVGAGEDGFDGGFLRSVDSPLHLFGAGYHRRRPQFGLHLPPLSGADDGGADSGTSANRSEDVHPFFFDGPPRRSSHRDLRDRQRFQRYLSPLHQISALAEMTDQAGHGQAVFGLLSALMSQQEVESLMNLSGLDDANGGDYEALLALAERIGDVNRGLSQSEINRLPTRKHKTDSAASKNESNSAGAGATGGTSPLSDQLQCHICLSDYESGDLKRLLPCGHDFHKDCVDTWLKVSFTNLAVKT
ncbi:RING finger protein 44 [Elysia marginata]|uniref:RING finger protein 44 n=1 Tax=Elysia marginata TaxID=1093978 RepID=A0AAV4I5P7_9GAST|nr:RING finger protein 44 [Elysia marginata]